MSSMWKKALHGDNDANGENNEKRLTPLSHRRLMRDGNEERKSLVDSEADSDDDVLHFDHDDTEEDKKKEKHLSPKPDKHRNSPLLSRSPSPLRKSPLSFLKSREHGNQEERASLIDVDDDGDEAGEDLNFPVEEISCTPADDKPSSSSAKNTPLVGIERPVASKWGKLKPLTLPPVESEKRVDIVGSGDVAQSNSLPKKVSPWQKLRAQNTADEQPKNVNFEMKDMASDKPLNPRLTSSGWGKLRARQNNTEQNNGANLPQKEISKETPEPRKLDSLANAAYALHATQKLTGVLKGKADKAKETVSIRQRLALKERMAKLVAERMTIRQIFKRYVETSTLHGFCYVCTETFIVRRVIWALLMIFGAVYFLIKLNDGIHRYFTYPISTLSSTIYVPNLILPAISFCPVNPYKLANFNTSILHKIQATSGLPLFNNWTDPGFNVSGNELREAIFKHAYDIDDLAQECDYIKQDTDHPMRPHRDCGPHNFTRYISQRGEVCFTVNSGHDDHPILNVDHSGIGYGYELLFDLNSPGSVLMESFNGIRVILHDQQETPVFHTGFLLTPGFKSFVRIERTETHNLPPPVATRCGSKQLKHSEDYNQKNCFLEVITNRTGVKCGCRELYMPDNGLPFCSLHQQLSCTQPFKAQISQLELIEECPIDCQVTSFDAKVTDTRFLHNAPQGLVPDILTRNAGRRGKDSSHLVKIYEEFKGTDDLDLYIEENVIQALFFFSDMKKTVNQQIQTFTFYHFLGDLGGEFGLMLGASLLTFAEFMDLLIFLLYHQMLRLHKQKKESVEQQKT